MVVMHNHHIKIDLETSKKNQLQGSWFFLIDKDNYINLLIIKPFKAGVTEPKRILISIDS